MNRPQKKYEIEFVSRTEAHCHDCYAILMMLTGLPFAEIYERLPKALFSRGWYTREFKDAFRLLGFDCNPTFKKFDASTPYPCLLRFRPTKRRMVERRAAGEKPDFWDAYVYYDGLVYSPDEECVYPLTLFDPGLKITSMLQVWISDL